MRPMPVLNANGMNGVVSEKIENGVEGIPNKSKKRLRLPLVIIISSAIFRFCK
jgi:hypothetical protein